MAHDIYTVSSYAPRPCGIATFTRSFLGGLKAYTGEIGSMYVYAIDDSNEGPIRYDPLVESTINQFEKDSWIRNAGILLTKSSERRTPNRKPVVVLQHEFGLDGKNAEGDNYPLFAGIIKSAKIPVYTYLHTVSTKPTKHQLDITKRLSDRSDRLIVTTESAIDILSEHYGIPRSKTKHIDHGIRMQDHSKYQREDVKRNYGLEDFFIVSTIGLKSVNKGLDFGIEGFAKFIDKLPRTKKKNVKYILPGQFHPSFVQQNGGKFYKEYVSKLEKIATENKIKTKSIKKIEHLNDSLKKNDVVFFDEYLSENLLLDFYGMTDIVMLPYRNPEQISSGILADTVGSGRAVVSSKFLYSLDLLSKDGREAKNPGITIDEIHGKGVLIDMEKKDNSDLFDPDTDQISEGLYYLFENKKQRLDMERRQLERSYKMRWDIVSGDFVRDVQFIDNLKK